MQECELYDTQALHRQADNFCPFGVMPAKDRVNRAKEKKETTLEESYEMLFDSGPLISGSLCISLCIAQSFSLPFTRILPSTSLSFSWFPAAMKSPGLSNSGVHHSIQLGSQNSVFLTAASLKRLLTAPDELKKSLQAMLYASCHSSARLNSIHFQTL